MNVMEAMLMLISLALFFALIITVSFVWCEEIGRLVYWAKDQRTYWRMGYKLRFGRWLAGWEETMWTIEGFDCYACRQPCLLWFYWEDVQRHPHGPEGHYEF